MDRLNSFYKRSYVDEASIDSAELGRLMTLVYKWMASGLALTGITALLISKSEAMLNLIFGNPLIFFACFFGELALVYGISARIAKMSAQKAGLLFYLYSILNGITLSYIFILYTKSSIASTFFATAGTFGAVSLYGYATKKDLTSAGSFFIMGLFGIIIASVVNFFLQSPTIVWMINYLGVFIFIGLTAYDTQKIKYLMVTEVGNVSSTTDKKAIFGALALYLDFINLFLFLLRIVGGRRD